MINHEQEYINCLKQAVYQKISDTLTEQVIEQVVKIDLYESHITSVGSANFQRFYFESINNENSYLTSKDFFRVFKAQYSLQGIDNKYLDSLEFQKTEILKLIREDNLAKLYFKWFRKAKIKHNDKDVERDLGSFFAKLVHTFRPHDYCALDNPIKEFFGLKKESFFIAFLIVSTEYRHWADSNTGILRMIIDKLQHLDKEKIIKYEQLTDLKLLDLIFWSKANLQKKKVIKYYT